MKMLSENDFGYRIEPIGEGLGIWVSTKIEKDVDHICKQPNGPGRAVKLPTNVLVSVMIVVSHRDDFTPVVRMQPFTKFISRD